MFHISGKCNCLEIFHLLLFTGVMGLRREEQATHVELQIPFLLVRASCVPVREQVSRRLQPDHFQTCITGLLSICLFLSIPLPYQEVKHWAGEQEVVQMC